MIIFSGEVFRDVCHGNARFFTPAWQWRILGEADQLVVQANTSEAGGTTPKVIIAVEWSNDGANWTTKINVISQVLTPGQNSTYIGVDDSGVPSGAYARLHVEMDGADHVALIQVLVTARMKTPRNGRPPALFAPTWSSWPTTAIAGTGMKGPTIANSPPRAVAAPTNRPK